MRTETHIMASVSAESFIEGQPVRERKGFEDGTHYLGSACYGPPVLVQRWASHRQHPGSRLMLGIPIALDPGSSYE